MNGMVYLVGAGPGDYRLITLKGKECLEKADVVICDYLADKRLMAFAKDDVEYIYVGKKSCSFFGTQWRTSHYCTAHYRLFQ